MQSEGWYSVTIKPVYKDHSNEKAKPVVIDRLVLFKI